MFIINNTSNFNGDSAQLFGLFICVLLTVVVSTCFYRRFLSTQRSSFVLKNSTRNQQSQIDIFSLQRSSVLALKNSTMSDAKNDTLKSKSIHSILPSLEFFEATLFVAAFFLIELFVQAMNATLQFVTLNHVSQNSLCTIGRKEILTSNGNKFLSIIAGICHE